MKWYNPIKDFGFITPNDEGADIFVSYAGIVNSEDVKEDDHVSYFIETRKKGPMAVNVEKIDP